MSSCLTHRHAGARQKEKVRNLEQMVVAAWSSDSSNRSLQVPDDQLHGSETIPWPSPKNATAITTNKGIMTPKVTSSDMYQSMLPLSVEDNARCYRIVVRENFTMRDIVKYGLIVLGFAMDTAVFDSATSCSSRIWMELVISTCGDVDMRQVVVAGVKVLARLTAPDEWPGLDKCPNLCTDTITLTAISFASALHANAVQLGVSPEELMDDEAQSRFYLEDSALIAHAMSNEGHIAPDLVPTTAQRQVRHHPCYDLVPWPHFRSNVIMLASTDPPMIDEDDLCLDMMSGGLRCWGSAHRRGYGLPWDGRSWEALPWFLEKWKVAIRGDVDGISSTSAWWRAMQDAT